MPAVRSRVVIGMLLAVACVFGTAFLLLCAWIASADIDPGDEAATVPFLVLAGLWAVGSGITAWVLLRPAPPEPPP